MEGSHYELKHSSARSAPLHRR